MKKTLLLLLVFATLATGFPSAAERPPDETLAQIVFKPGDVNNDGIVDINDVMAVRDIIFGERMGVACIDAADVAEPFETVNIADILLMVEHIFGRVDLWDGLVAREVADWEKAYYEVMRASSGIADIACLIDLDFDGTPELLLATTEVVNDYLFQGYSYKEGKIITIDGLQDLPVNFALMKDKITGERAWLAFGFYIIGVGEKYAHHSVWVEYDGFAKITQRPFLTWAEVSCDPEAAYIGTDFERCFVYYGPNGQDQLLSYATIHDMALAKFAENDEMPIKYFSSPGPFLRRRFLGYDFDAQIYYNIMKFFDEWEETPLALSGLQELYLIFPLISA